MADINHDSVHIEQAMPLADVSNTEWRQPKLDGVRCLATMPLADVSNTEWRHTHLPLSLNLLDATC